jgi:uncharacterized protein YndB with AHSA1/START domain
MATVAHDVHAKVDPKKAYEAISTEAGFRNWWTRGSKVDPKVGGEAEFRFGLMGGAAMTFRIEEIEPGKGVKLRCIRTDPPGGHVGGWVGTVLEFRVEPGAGGDTAVHIVHGGWPDSMPKEALDGTQQGWAHFGASLKQYLDTGTGAPDAGG